MRRVPALGSVLLPALLASPAGGQTAPDLWSGFDGESYALVEDETGYRLTAAGREPIAVPRAWLEPEAARREDENTYVSSLEWGRPVTAFPLGDGRVGLHLSSYEIAKEGSAMAASGRDLFLLLDPATARLRLGLGVDAGLTKGRVRVGGCFAAWYHRLHLGDVDCDGRLDLGAVEERIDCTIPDEEDPSRGPILQREPLRWFVLGEEGWRERPDLAGHLPCFGIRPFPPLGLEQGPVDWVLEMTKLRAPLLPPRGGAAPPKPR